MAFLFEFFFTGTSEWEVAWHLSKSKAGIASWFLNLKHKLAIDFIDFAKTIETGIILSNLDLKTGLLCHLKKGPWLNSSSIVHFKFEDRFSELIINPFKCAGIKDLFIAMYQKEYACFYTLGFPHQNERSILSVYDRDRLLRSNEQASKKECNFPVRCLFWKKKFSRSAATSLGIS